MREIITFDKFLSVWIVLYSIGYILQIFPFNPLILLAISILFFIFTLIIIIYNHNKNSNLLYFFFINFIFKIPLFAIVYYRTENITEFDILFTFYVILVYIIYIEIMNDNIYCIYNDMISFVIDKNKGRFPQIFYNLKKYIHI
jgi:hypothetical protein